MAMTLGAPPGIGAPSAAPPAPRTAAAPTLGAQTTPVPVGLAVSPSGYGLSPTFWGTTVSAEAPGLPDMAQVLNATPSEALVWPGANAGDRLDALNDTLLTTKGSTLSWHAPATNETEFIAECRAIDCTAILQVPGEIDDPSFAAAMVNYTEKKLGFYPAYWEIGNEPELWKHWKVPWDQWNTPAQNGSARITPGEYAWEVHNYTAVMRTADPNVRILGLPGTGRPQHKVPLSEWLNATVAVNGNNLAGVAFHVYTAGTKGNRTLAQFYAFDTGPYSLVGRIQNARSAISNQMNVTCPGCADPPILITEFGSALSHYGFANLSRGLAGGLSLTISEIEGMELNVTSLDGFAAELGTSNSWFALNGAPRPAYTIYSQLLSRLGREVYPVGFTVPPGSQYSGTNASLSSNLYGVATRASASGGRSDLLLVNVNQSTNVTLSPTLPGIAPGTPAELWEWEGQSFYSATNDSYWVEPETPLPTATYFPLGMPTGWVLPAQTIALIESYPVPATPVVFAASGLPTSGTSWYLEVDGQMHQSFQADLTCYLPQGTSTLAPVAIPLPIGTEPKVLRERLEAFPPASVTVGSSPPTFTIPFVAQWALHLSVSPVGEGVITPGYPWANASVPTLLGVVTAPGYVLEDWSGSGHGSYSGTRLEATVLAQDPVNETAVLEPGFDISFVETGLPSGKLWSLTLDGSTESTSTSELVFFRGNGTYLFSVGKVAGYTPNLESSWVLVNGSSLPVDVRFAPVVALFPVVWQESGLGSSTDWEVVVNDVAYPTTSAWATVDLANGTYAWAVPRTAVGAASPSSGVVTVAGAALALPVRFSRPTFEVHVTATGLPAGASWTLSVSGSEENGTSTGALFMLSNGSYNFKVDPPSGYDARPATGTFWVNGTSASLSLGFYPGAPIYSLAAGGPVEPLLILLVFVIGAAVAWGIVSLVVRSRTSKRPSPGASTPPSIPARRTAPHAAPPSAPTAPYSSRASFARAPPPGSTPSAPPPPVHPSRRPPPPPGAPGSP